MNTAKPRNVVRRFTSVARGIIGLLVVSGLTVPAHAQTGNAKARPEQPKAAKAAVTAPAPAVMVTQAFAQRGVSKCVDRIGQYSQFLTNGAEVGGQVFVSPEDADRRIASASLEIQAGPSIGYAGLTFSPDSGANRCGAVYELVSYWPNTCEEVATKAYASFKVTAPLRKTVMSLDGGPTVRVFLLPAGTGCVSIKKEITY